MNDVYANKALAALFAPTPEIAVIARELIEELEIPNMDVFDTYNEELLEKIKKENYQLVIANGACAQIFHAIPKLTVLDILPDISSFVDDIKYLSEQGAKHIAIFASPHSINTYNSFDLTGVKLTFHPVYDMKELPTMVGELHLSGADAVLAGQLVADYLRSHYPHILTRVNSCSRQALANILRAARRILHLEKVKRLQLTRLDLLINNIQEGAVIFNKTHETVFHNALAEKILKDYDL